MLDVSVTIKKICKLQFFSQPERVFVINQKDVEGSYAAAGWQLISGKNLGTMVNKSQNTNQRKG